jgi:hypothetical protein
LEYRKGRQIRQGGNYGVPDRAVCCHGSKYKPA